MVVAFYVITILIGEQYIAQARGVELFFSVSGVLCIVMGIVLLVIRARKIPKEEKERIKRAKKQKKAAKTRSKFEEQQRIERESLDKLRTIIEVSDKIEIEMMRESLKMNKGEFLDKIYGWAKEFNFRIDGNFLVINQETVGDFLDALDKQFDTWERREAEREGKI